MHDIFNVTYLKSKVEMKGVLDSALNLKKRNKNVNILSPPMCKTKWNHRNDIQTKEDNG